MKSLGKLDQGHLNNLASILKQGAVLQLGLAFATISIGSFIAGYFFAQNRNTISTQSQEVEICRKVNSGDIQALNAGSVAHISGLQEISNQLQKVEVDLAKAKTRFTDDHPTIVNLKQDSAALKSVLQQNLNNVCKN